MKIAVMGASGRMGKEVLAATERRSDMELAAAYERPEAGVEGMPASALGAASSAVKVTSDLESALVACDCAVDFTRPEASMMFLDAALKAGKNLVIGTTGFDEGQLARIHCAAKRIRIALAPNFSVGVNVVFGLLAQAERALGADYDVEIVEAHHRRKVDAPSGTALRMGEILAKEMGGSLKELGVMGRNGNVGPRKKGTIGSSAVRGGDIAGEHVVIFAGDGERVEIGHRASGRSAFADGALRAAAWLKDQKPGLYDMQDVLGL